MPVESLFLKRKEDDQDHLHVSRCGADGGVQKKIGKMENRMENEREMLNGSSCGTEKAFTEGRGAELGVFIGIQRSLRGAADQEWNAYAKKGYKIALARARSTKEVEDEKHTSGGVVIAVKESCLGKKMTESLCRCE